MNDLLKKLNFKDQKRIAIINADKGHSELLTAGIDGVITDTEIDQRCPYSFILIFVTGIAQVNEIAPVALHNLTADGILWFCYPKKTSPKYKTDLNRDNGWDALTGSGFRGIRIVSIDDDWSALRFRNIKYIKSTRK
jgi:hypothetical protein